MRLLGLSLHWLVLRLYPPAFRREWGASMRATFVDVASREGWLRALRRETRDALRTAPGLWRESFRRPRDPRPREGLDGLRRDLRDARRSLVRSPGFTGIAAVSLALGIGANAAVVSLVDAVLFRPMPVQEPDRLVALYATRSTERYPLNFSYPNYRDISEASDVFSDVVGFQGAALSFEPGSGQPELLWGEVVTANYFSGLGVTPAVGRVFSDEDTDAPIAVLSHGLWERRFDGSPSVVGRTLRINGQEITVVGVAAVGFTGAKLLGFNPDLWVPIGLHATVWPGIDDRLDRRSGGWLNVRARLAPGVSADRAEAALTTIASRLEAAHPDVNREWRLHAIPASRKTEPAIEVELGGMLPVASGVLLAVVGIVLLIAAANVASLQLARTLSRRRELAIRLSMGATRARLVRQLLIESLVLTAVGLGLGLWLGKALLAGALRLSPVLDFSIDYGASIDGRVIAVTTLIALVTGLVAGLLPALRASRRDVHRTLKESGRLARGGAGRRLIVIPQLALSLVALVCAGLLVDSFRNIRAESPGFATDHLLLASVNVELAGYSREAGEAFYRDVVARLRGVAGVRAVSLASPLPLDAYSESERVWPEDREADDDGTFVFSSTVAEGYFETLSTPLVAGRGFTSSDDENGRPVAIVNETLAQSFWPNENALGKRLLLRSEGPGVEVVGVARNGKYLTLGEEPRPYLYLPLAQNYRSPLTIVVATLAPPASLEPVLRAEVERLDATLPVYGVKTMEEFIGRSLVGARALALAVSGFALLALALTTIGVYGLTSFLVSQRRHELGIRMALGAGRGQVVRLFLAETGRTVAIGLAIGLAVAFLSARAIQGVLFGVSAASPAVFGLVSLSLAFVALSGGYFPSRRASRLDPLKTLRHD